MWVVGTLALIGQSVIAIFFLVNFSSLVEHIKFVAVVVSFKIKFFLNYYVIKHIFSKDHTEIT